MRCWKKASPRIPLTASTTASRMSVERPYCHWVPGWYSSGSLAIASATCMSVRRCFMALSLRPAALIAWSTGVLPNTP